MPMPPAHALFGLAAAYSVRPRDVGMRESAFLCIALVLTQLPDFDIALGLLVTGQPWVYHRGPTHSLFFVAVSAVLTTFVLHRASSLRVQLQLGSTYAAIVLSHVLLDSVWPRYGIQLYWPFSNRTVRGPDLLFLPDLHNLTGELLYEIFFGGCALLLVLILTRNRLRLGDKLKAVYERA